MKVVEVTLARDPAFTFHKPTSAAETTDKGSPPFHALSLRGYTGWLWDLKDQTEGGVNRVRWRVIISLVPDKRLVMEGKGSGPWEDPIEFVKRFDLPRIQAALGSPPRTDFQRTAKDFHVFTKGESYADIIAWVGYADDEETRGDDHVLVYRLSGGDRMLFGFPDTQLQSLNFLLEQHNDGTVRELL